MSGKGVARLLLLVVTALVGAGLTFGAMHAPLDPPKHEEAQPQR